MSQQIPQIVTARRSQIQNTGNHISPAEAFKRGFYGGFGLWCSFMLLNIALFLAGWLILIMLGIVTFGAAGIQKQFNTSRQGTVTTSQELGSAQASLARSPT